MTPLPSLSPKQSSPYPAFITPTPFPTAHSLSTPHLSRRPLLPLPPSPSRPSPSRPSPSRPSPRASFAAPTTPSGLHLIPASPLSPPPPALFIHDFLTTSALFAPLLFPPSPLPTLARCCAYDLRGFGRSPDPIAPYSRTADAASVHKTLSAHPAHIVGAGLGGCVALDYALDSPDRVKSLTLISSGLTGYAWGKRPEPYFPLQDALGLGEGAAKESAGQWVAASLEWQRGLAGPHGAALRDMFQEYNGFHFWAHEKLMPDPFENEPLRDRLADVKCPVLVMAGEEEEGGDFGEVARIIAKRVNGGNGDVTFLKGAAHFGSLEAGEECAEAIAQFWKSIDP